MSFLLFVAIAAMPTFSRDVRFGVGRFLNNLKDYAVLPPSIVSGALERETMTSVTVKPGLTWCVLITTLVLLLFSLALFGQGNFGRILGSVKDSTGAVLPGATVNIIDTQRGPARTVTTDEAGLYNAPSLIPGTYTVRVEFPGFKTLDRGNVA